MKKIFLIIASLGIIFLAVFYLIRFFANSSKNGNLNIISNSETQEKIAEEKTGAGKIFENNFYPPILAFHNISASLKEDKWGLTINTQDLEKKLIQLKENNYETVFASEIGEYIKNGKKIPNNLVALTFDDGTIGFYTEVLPLLKKHNLKASLYIMTGVRSKNYVNSEQIKEIAESNLVEIGSHTVYHQRLGELSEADQFKELKNSKIFLENLLSKEITVICYPYGSYTEKTKELAKELGYLYGLDFNARTINSEIDPWAINRIGLSPQMDIIRTLNNLQQKNNSL